jgi:hypothetical protein
MANGTQRKLTPKLKNLSQEPKKEAHGTKGNFFFKFREPI